MIKRLLVSLLVCLCALALAQTSAQTSVEVRVAQSSDDAEEFPQESSLGPAGTVFLDSSDLELVQDNDIFQVVGMRFADVALPQGATITSAYVQFTVDETTDAATEVTVQGEASENAATFTNTEAGVSSRPLTAASVTWSPAPWTQEGASGAEQQTNDLSSIVQEIVDQPGWQSGNALAIIMAGSGKRTAESFDGNQGAAPLLYVEYQADGATPAETGGADVEQAETGGVETGGVETEQAETETGGTETGGQSEATEAETGGETEPMAEQPETGGTEAEDAEPEDAEPEDAETEDTETETTQEEPEAEPETEAVEPAPTPVPALQNSRLVREQRYSLSSAGDSNVNGTLIIGDYGTSSLIITVILNRQPADATYAADLYRGDCGSDTGERLVTLKPVQGQRGSISVTSMPLSFDSLEQADLYLNITDSADGSGNIVACGEVGAQ